MQVIWNSQNNEKLYAINEETLHKQIQQKSRSVNQKVEKAEWGLIAMNLIVALILIGDTIVQNESAAQYIPAVAYLGFGIFGLVRRLSRQKKLVSFDASVLGQLNKAISQMTYLIEQSTFMMRWYVLPLVAMFLIDAYSNGSPFWLWTIYLGLIPLAYFGGRWEINRWYIPKKHRLESLRETLTTTPEPHK
ncbi:MAG: hypothetical protein ACPG8W_06210 [Candidatus Promineifilaceae bacterium]